MKLPTGVVGRLVKYQVIDEHESIARLISQVGEVKDTNLYGSRKVRKEAINNYLNALSDNNSLLKNLYNYAHNIVFQSDYEPDSRTSIEQKQSKLESICEGSSHKVFRDNGVILHGVPHVQQASPNGCADACIAMLAKYFDSPKAKGMQGTYHNDVFIHGEVDRPFYLGPESTEMVKAALDHKIALLILKKHDPQSVREQLEKTPLLASLKSTGGLFSHAVVVVGMINDPWRGGHQLKPEAWLQENLDTSSKDCLCKAELANVVKS